MSAIPQVVETWEGTSVVMMARVVDSAGANLQQAGVDADPDGVLYYIYDMDDGTEESNGNLVRGTVLFDALQTGDPWTKDTTGYNFKWIADDSLFPNAATSKRYRVVVRFVSTTYKSYVVFLIGRNNIISEAAP